MEKKEIVQTENAKIPVTVHIPDKIPERVRQQKINRLYDLLKPKETNKSA